MHRVRAQRHLRQAVVALFAEEPGKQVARFLVAVDAARLERSEVVGLGLVFDLGGTHARALGAAAHVPVLRGLAILQANALLRPQRLLELLNDRSHKALRRLARLSRARRARCAARARAAQLHHDAVDQRNGDTGRARRLPL